MAGSGSQVVERVGKRLGSQLLVPGSAGRVSPGVLLQQDHVGELPTTDRARVDGGLGAVDTHVSLEVALGRERSTAEPAAERPLARVRAVVHQQGAATAERAQTDRALVRVQTTTTT